MAKGKTAEMSQGFRICRLGICLALIGLVGCSTPESSTPAPAEAPSESAQSEATEMKSDPWAHFDSGTEATLRGLSAAGDGVVWVTGSQGTVLRSTDGGQFWQSLPPRDSAEFEIRDVEAWNAETAVLQVAGQPARFYRTIDGGASYDVVYEHESEKAFFDGFAFWPEDDRARGIAYSDPVDGVFLVAVTEDQGASWSTLGGERFPAAREGEAGFAASGTGLAVAGTGSVWIGMGGPSARILRSTDLGDTWTATETAIRSGSPSSGVFSIGFRSPEVGLAVGGDYQDEKGLEGTLAATRDGGETWTEVAGLTGFRSCVLWIADWMGSGEGAWVATGPLGTDVSLDDGQNWQPFGDEGFHVMSLSPDGELWAAGAGGKIARLKTP